MSVAVTAPPAPGRRRMLLVLLVIAAVLAIVYAGVGTYAYLQFAPVSAGCPATEGFSDIQEPSAFTASTVVDGVKREVDTKPYLMPTPRTVTFPARSDPAVTIAAWWEPVDALDAPTVIVVHGANGCRRNSGNLLVAGMLHRNGIAVLLIDMRNHGDSTVEDGKFAGGTDEHLDVLGAFDWLRSQGVPAGRIGLFGFSGGAIASMIAIGEESQVTAIWADSSYTTAAEAFRDGLAKAGLPTFFDAGAILAGRILTGEDLSARSPLAAAAKLSGRSVFLAHGALDTKINPAFQARLADAARTAGATVETWLIADASHTQAHFLHPAEYEQGLARFVNRSVGRK